MDDLLKELEHGVRFVYGRPEVVEAELERVRDSYVCTNLFFYVVKDQLEVAATLLHQKEVRKSQLANAALLTNPRMRPN